MLGTPSGDGRSPQLRYSWPGELDLMARIAGLHLTQRWGGLEPRGVHVPQHQRHLGLRTLRRLCLSVQVGQHGLDRPDLVGNEHGVRLAVIRDAENAREYPAFASLPGGDVDVEGLPVGLASVA